MSDNYVWILVEDGEYRIGLHGGLTIQGGLLGVAIERGQAFTPAIQLPDDVRLCRRVPRAGVGVPEPDWSQAPEWAMWWCCEMEGYAYWSKQKPEVNYPEMAWDIHEQYELEGRHGLLPIGIDWRTTLRQRPQAQEGDA